MKGSGKIIPVLLLFLCEVSLAFAGQWMLGDTQASVFLPEKWFIQSQDYPDSVVFCNPHQSLLFQVTCYPGEKYGSDLTMMEEQLSLLDVRDVEKSRISYLGKNCSLVDISFLSGGSLVRGWFLFLDRDDRDYVLLTLVAPEDYTELFPLILSCLDGFAPNEEGRQSPGVIEFFMSASSKELKDSSIPFAGKNLSFKWSPSMEEARRLLVEREAGILSAYDSPEDFEKAWQRYYQILFRACASGLDALAGEMGTRLEGLGKREKAETLLAWLQEFQYGSTSSFSDLLLPGEVLRSEKGDCDALALVYIMLLKKMGVDGVLMVSRTYSHAMAAVHVPGEGAGFDFKGKHYIVAELTRKVALGQIAADQSDLEQWLIIPFEDYTLGRVNLDGSKK